jgi:hypothetical protein
LIECKRSTTTAGGHGTETPGNDGDAHLFVAHRALDGAFQPSFQAPFVVAVVACRGHHQIVEFVVDHAKAQLVSKVCNVVFGGGLGRE